VASVVCGFWTIALGTACDSSQRQREPRGKMNPAATRSTLAATPAPVYERVAAIGDTVQLAPDLRRALDPGAFEPMPLPAADDWLARHPEKPQSFPDYMRADRNVPTPQRNVIYLLPVGAFPATAPPLAPLADIVHPLHVCPVCLRKLHSAIAFDPAAREDALAAAFGRLGIDDEAAWSAARATWIRNGIRAVR